MLIIHTFEIVQKLNTRNSKLLNKNCKKVSIYNVSRDDSSVSTNYGEETPGYLFDYKVRLGGSTKRIDLNTLLEKIINKEIYIANLEKLKYCYESVYTFDVKDKVDLSTHNMLKKIQNLGGELLEEGTNSNDEDIYKIRIDGKVDWYTKQYILNRL